MNSTSSPLDTDTRPIFVLHVDDEPAYGDLVATHLERHADDLRVSSVTSVADAIEHLDSSPVDCVVSDHEMPGRSGLDLLGYVRERDPDFPYILVPGQGSEELASEAIGAGVTDYIPKGRSTDRLDEVAARIERHVTARRETDGSLRETDGSRRETDDSLRETDGSRRGATGTGRDVSELAAREEQLEALNHATRGLLTATTRDAVAEIAVEAARDILGLQSNAIHLYDEAVDGLVPVARTDALVEYLGEPPTLDRDGSIAWRVYDEGTATAVDDTRADPDVANPDTVLRSELYLPLGHHGILIAGAPTTNAFDSRDLTVGEILAANVTTALDQVAREQELREREAELERQNERLAEFTSIVSHDLRNPLSVAEGWITLAREDGDSEYLQKVADAHEHMRVLIEELLTLARGGDVIGTLDAVPLDSLVRSCWDHVETADASLEIDTDAVVMADESRLDQLVGNLLRNAIEHGGDDVTVTVGDRSDGFFVADDGDGIDPKDRMEVFATGYTTIEDGTGFGLSIVRQIAGAHGWDVQVTESVDGGARFEFTGVEFAH